MLGLVANCNDTVGGFPIEGRLYRYSSFVPRLFNLCLHFGFRAGLSLPSRAFCSDESQGYPIILLAKHFGAFPFNHGRVGGVVATGRHGPHASHGEDLVLIQASHVGFDAERRAFGDYRRLQTAQRDCTPTCGKLFYVMEWYRNEYQFLCDNTLIEKTPDGYEITIDNQLLSQARSEGLFLRLERILEPRGEGFRPIRIRSTAKTFPVVAALHAQLDQVGFAEGQAMPIGQLDPHLFYFRREIEEGEEGRHHLEHNLIDYMPFILTAPSPALMAAQINTQVEFDRTYRSLLKGDAYRGKRVLFISGINIDISPQAGQIFPLTKFVPWAAYLQGPGGEHRILEQDELVALLNDMPEENAFEINLDEAIALMKQAEEVTIKDPIFCVPSAE